MKLRSRGMRKSEKRRAGERKKKSQREWIEKAD